MITHIADHADQAVARLPHPDRTAPNLVLLVQTLVARHQQLEDVANDMIHDRLLENAEGETLSRWGALVGVSQDGVTTAEYRNLIRARIMANTSTGTREEMIAITKLATGATFVHLHEAFPKTAIIGYIVATPLSDAARQKVLAMLNDAKPLGTQLNWTLEALSGVPYFAYGSFPGAAGYGVGWYMPVIS